MNLPTVYVVQDNGRNNFSLASRFGTIKNLLPARLQLQGDSTEVVETLSQSLFGFNDADSLLAAGDPACIGIAVAIAAAENDGIVYMLKYDRQTNDYYRIKIDLAAALIAEPPEDLNRKENNYNV